VLCALCHCLHLQVLNLAGHSFDGTLPAAWTRLEQLRVLDISNNNLSGSLPAWYSSMRQLAIFKANGNQLSRSASGSPEFYELLLGPSSRLQCLSVGDNKDMLLDATTSAKLAAKAQQRLPAMPLAMNEPSSALCDPAPWT
jgi:hypothetical protein